MKQARHLMTAEHGDDAARNASQERPTQFSQLGLGSLCTRLARAIAVHDHVGAGRMRGTLARLSLKNHSRMALARRAYRRTITLGVDA